MNESTQHSMTSTPSSIQHVSDTAMWVAHYRALETERPDALFKDPYAKLLVGERGKQIAETMKGTSRYTSWSIVIRTFVIDELIERLVAEGVDTVINLGAGLDTRPYRMKLPANLKWIEIDYSHMIAYKEQLLKLQTPTVCLKRISLDLANRVQRQALFAELAKESKSTLILTEGVIPYLTEEQVETLGLDLYAHKNFGYWIGEYFSPSVYRYLKANKLAKRMKNAPFQFFPSNWFEFFKKLGWDAKEIHYLSQASARARRKPPFPWWNYIFGLFMTKDQIKQMQKRMAYVLYTRPDALNR